jgi:O-glycosyl hydrolase
MLVLLSLAASAETTVRVDPQSVFQTFEGWGTSLCWWANMAGSFSAPTRQRIAQDLFTLNDNGLGLTIVRFNAGGGENPALPNSMEVRARMEGYWPAPDASYNWDADQTQRTILADAIGAARGAGLRLKFEVFANSPPWWMTISGSATGNTGPDGKPAENLRPDQFENFASYLIQVTEFLETSYRIKVDSISPFNEPTSAWWTYGGRQEGCFFTHASMARLVSIFQSKLGDARPRLAAPEDWSFPQSIVSWDSWATDTQAAIGRINTHAYSGNGRSTLRARAEQSRKKIRVSEYGDGDGSGRTLAATVLEDLKYLEASSWVNWQAVSPDHWGMLANDYVSEAYNREVKFYVMAQFSRFLRPGYRIIGADDPRCLAAFDSRTGTLALVFTNVSAVQEAVHFDLSRFNLPAKTGEWYQTEFLNASGDRLARRVLLTPGGKFLDVELQPSSISTFVIEARPTLADAGFSGSGVYSLRNVATGLYMSIDDTSTPAVTAGAPLTLRDRQNSAVQKFRIDAVESGWFRLVNRCSGYDVNVRGASLNPGTPLIQWLETNIAETAKNSQWSFEWNDDGTCRIKGRQSGLYIEPLDPSGSALVQNIRGTETQLWTLQRVEPHSAKAPPSR